jgi:hypothetical protein
MPNDIQSVRYELPMQAPRGFMDYAADAAMAYYKKKKETEDAKRAEMLAIFPTLAANNGVRRATAGETPDATVGGVPWMMDGSSGGLNVPMDVGGSTVNFPIRSLADYNTLSTIRKREAPPSIPPGTAFQAAITAPGFWQRYPKQGDWQKQAAKDIYGLQQEYSALIGSNELPATKTKHVYSGEYNGQEVYSNDQVNWYDADGNLVQE